MTLHLLRLTWEHQNTSLAALPSVLLPDIVALSHADCQKATRIAQTVMTYALSTALTTHSSCLQVREHDDGNLEQPGLHVHIT